MLNKIGLLPQPRPSASGAPGGAAEKSTGTAAAWLREMERQELASWLQHGPLPSGKREPALFGQGPQSVIAPAPPAQAPDPGQDSVPEETDLAQASEIATHAVSPLAAQAGATQAPRLPLNATGTQAPASPPPHATGPRLDTVAHGGLPQIAPVRACVPDRLAQYVMDQVLQESRKDIALPPVAGLVAGSQAAHDAPLDLAPPAVRPAAAFDPVRAGGGVGQRDAIAAVPDEQDEMAAQRSAPSSLPQDEEAAPAVRVHTFWSGQSVRVWVGTDNSAALDAQQLALAVQDLRRLLREQGAALESLTVNGETVVEQDEAPAKPKEAPPPARGSATQA